MDLKLIIARMTSDCDLRNRFIRKFPSLLDNYVLSKDGQIITLEEARQLEALKYFFDGLSFVSSRVWL